MQIGNNSCHKLQTEYQNQILRTNIMGLKVHNHIQKYYWHVIPFSPSAQISQNLLRHKATLKL